MNKKFIAFLIICILYTTQNNAMIRETSLGMSSQRLSGSVSAVSALRAFRCLYLSSLCGSKQYSGDRQVEILCKKVEAVLLGSASFRDTRYESFYHGLMLGIASQIFPGSQYTLKSNRESGLGLYDLAAIPADQSNPVIIFELKACTFAHARSLEDRDQKVRESLYQALRQIVDREYYYDFKEQGYNSFVLVAVVFCGKQMYVAQVRSEKDIRYDDIFNLQYDHIN